LRAAIIILTFGSSLSAVSLAKYIKVWSRIKDLSR
jgi:hypothetical protein